MKNIKLKQTNLCFLILLSPLLVALALIFGSIAVADIMPEESIWYNLPFVVIILIIVAAIILFAKRFSVWMVLLVAIESIDRWKKDRQFYFTEVNGRTVESASELIKFRMNHYAKELPLEKKGAELLGAFKKRRHSWDGDTSGFEDYYTLYGTDALTTDFCSRAVAESKSIMRKYGEKGLYPFLQTRRERKRPVTRACATVIVCNKADFDVVSYVRRNFSKGHTGLAVCICEMSTGRYFLNGAAQSKEWIFETGAEAIAINLIKKAVFCKKLNIRENSHYMPTHDLPFDPEETFYNTYADIKKDLKTSSGEAKRIAKSLKDGEVYFYDDTVYYKKGERTCAYTVMGEDEIEGEEKTDKKTVLIDRSWSYPKTSKMSKKDYDEALLKIDEHLKSSGMDFEFKTFEKWLEEH